MLEKLMSLIRDHSQEAVVRNPAVPDQHNNDVMQTLMGSIMGGFQQEAQNGNINGLIALLSGRGTNEGGTGMLNNPIVAGISTNAISTITERFRLSNSAASHIVSAVLPAVLGNITAKVSNPNDNSLDFNGILTSLMGNSTNASAGAQSAGFDYNQIGYAMADGKLDVNDLIQLGSSFMGGNQPSSPKNEQDGPDLGGLLGGLFGKK